jgi:hypothetical protein
MAIVRVFIPSELALAVIHLASCEASAFGDMPGGMLKISQRFGKLCSYHSGLITLGGTLAVLIDLALCSVSEVNP